MTTEDASKKDPMKLLEEQIKLAKETLAVMREQMKFRKKEDRNTTMGSKKDEARAVKNANYLKAEAARSQRTEIKDALSNRLQIKQRTDAFKQFQLIAKGAKANSKGDFRGMPTGSKELSGMSVFKKFNLQMKNVATMVNPKGMDKKKAASGAADAMKGVMKFAVGGSIVGMLGKKLFDSSPLLKTMMSLFNTSIMLIFRPIGDFIGSFLRPLMLFFMKNIAIPFYKNSKHAMGLGEQWGKSALGFLLKPQETISAAIISGLSDVLPPSMLGGQGKVEAARTYSGVMDWQLDQLVKTGRLGGKEGVMSTINNTENSEFYGGRTGWNKLKPWIDNMMKVGASGGAAGYGITATGTSTPGATQGFYEDIAVSAEASAGLMEEVEGFMSKALIDGELVEGEWNELADIMGRAKLFGVDTSRAVEFIRDQMSASAAKLSDSWQKFQANSVRGGVGKDATKLVPAKKEIAKYRTDTSSGWGMGSVPAAGTGAAAIATRSSPVNQAIYSAASKKAQSDAYAHRANPGSGTMSYAERIKGKSLSEILGIQKAMGIDSVNKIVVGSRGSEILKAVDDARTDGTHKFSNDKEARKHAAAFSAAMTSYNLFGGQKPTMGDLTNIVNGKPSGSQGYANGGLITEPIFGVGRSGQTYTFGERGQETVTPGRGGTNYTLNINVGNVTREADFDKLKPLIQRWILESNSRRGVV